MANDQAADRLLIKPAEAAKLLSIGRTLLWELTQRGEVPFVRLGAAVRYNPERLREWIVEQQTKT